MRLVKNMQALIALRRNEVTERMSYNDIQVDEFSPDDIRKMMNTRRMLGTGCYGSVSFVLRHYQHTYAIIIFCNQILLLCFFVGTSFAHMWRRL